MMGTCHCSRCRKVGASTIVYVKKKNLRWIQGRESIAVYEPTAPYKYSRSFCKVCGSSLGEILSEDETIAIAANTLDTEFELRNQLHGFVAEKPSWYEICDEAKQFKRHPKSL